MSSMEESYLDQHVMYVKFLEESLKNIERIYNVKQKLRIKSYTHLKPVIQQGPTCGLTALSMITTLTGNPIEVDHLLRKSISLGYSACGEMFNASHLAQLAAEGLNDYKVKLYSDGISKNISNITQGLVNGYLYLVPYDTDKDNTPTVKNGHTAHWAVLCGLIENEQIQFAIARQTKSKYPFICSFEDLSESNENLVEVHPFINPSFILHDIKNTLANHFIELKRL